MKIDAKRQSKCLGEDFVVRGIAANAGISLDAQERDALDFHELHVSTLRRMLTEAYRRGKAAQNEDLAKRGDK